MLNPKKKKNLNHSKIPTSKQNPKNSIYKYSTRSKLNQEKTQDKKENPLQKSHKNQEKGGRLIEITNSLTMPL